MPSLVAMITFSRLLPLASHLPRIVSDSPPWGPSPPGRLKTRRIDEVQARFQSHVQLAKRVGFRQGPAVHVAAETKNRDFQIRLAEFHPLHEILLGLV